MAWLKTARPAQLPPDGDWLTWLINAGRGFGKTRAGAEWLAWEMQTTPDSRWAIVAPTSVDARDVCVEGQSGLLSVLPPECVADWQRSFNALTLRLTNGAIAKCYSAEEPSRLRGPQHHGAWCDELSSWRYTDTWDMMLFGLRLGPRPRRCVTTTPKPNPLTRMIMKDPETAITRGATYDNASNLPDTFLKDLRKRYEGTRLGRQELYAELLEDVPGALWTWETIRAAQEMVTPPLEDMKRIVIGVDPSGSDGETGDKQGIVGAGLCRAGKGHVLADLTMRGSPDEWARAAVRLFDDLRADQIVAERNYGGEMVRRVIQTVRPHIPVKLVTATRGKIVRAEPVAALYEQRRVTHAGPFKDLDEQMTLMTGDGFVGEGSPDNVDALVWALTDLMVQGAPTATMKIGFAR